MTEPTTPTGIPIRDCQECGRAHPITRPHCPGCGLALAFPHDHETQKEKP